MNIHMINRNRNRNIDIYIYLKNERGILHEFVERNRKFNEKSRGFL